MISIQRGYEDWKELDYIVKNVKDINVFVDLIEGNNRYEITNDLREKRGLIDLNYKSICATIKQDKDRCVLSYDNVEVWDKDGGLDFVNVNMYAYGNYSVKLSDYKMYVKKISPYDEQEYYYGVNDKIYRNGKFVEQIKELDNITLLDSTILRLIELNSTLNGIKAIY